MLTTHPSLPFSPEGRAAKGAKRLDFKFPGWALRLKPTGLMYDLRPTLAGTPTGWRGYQGLMRFLLDPRGLLFQALGFNHGTTDRTSFGVVWAHGMTYYEGCPSPDAPTPADCDRLDTAWAYEVFRRQQKVAFKGYLPLVHVDNDLYTRLRLGLVTLRPGQWIQLSWASRPCRWVGASPSGYMEVLHYPNPYTTPGVLGRRTRHWKGHTVDPLTVYGGAR